MSEASRAGWHAQHLRHGDAQAGQPASSNTRGDRRRLLKEAMRALDESDMARQAARNPSIVAADTHLNRAYVNDGEGGLRELSAAEGVEPVLEYGDGRINAVKRKWHPKSFETTTIVSWVPKSLLKEVPDYYPVYDKSGTEIGRRSRWVMPDDEAGKAEVDRWFRETHAHLTEDVLTGGHDSIHGVVWNFDESVPHVHWMCDTLAPLQKDLSVGEHGIMLDRSGDEVVKYKRPVTVGDAVDVTQDLDGTWRVTSAPEIEVAQIAGIDHHGYLVGASGERLHDGAGKSVRASADLRVEAQQMWGQSSEVTETRMIDGVEKQVKITGATKLSNYQEVYRERLVEAGFDVALEVDPEGTSLDKAAFGASEAEKLSVATEAEKLAAERAELDQRVEYVAKQMERLDARDAELTEREDQVEAERQRGYTDGLAQGAAAWEAEHGAAYRAQVRGKVEERAQAQAESIISNAQNAAETEGAKIIAAANKDAKEIRRSAAAELDERETSVKGREDSVTRREQQVTATETVIKDMQKANREAERRLQDEAAQVAESKAEADAKWAEVASFDRTAAEEEMPRWILGAMRKDKTTFAGEGKNAFEHYVEIAQSDYNREKRLGRNVDIRQTEGQRKKAMNRTLGDAASKSAEHSRRQRQSDDRSYGQE